MWEESVCVCVCVCVCDWKHKGWTAAGVGHFVPFWLPITEGCFLLGTHRTLLVLAGAGLSSLYRS